MAILTVLLVFQTILSPLGMFGVTFASAESGDVIQASDLVAKNTGIQVTGKNGAIISDSANIPKDYSPKKGDTVYLNYEFDLKPSIDYAAGSTFTFLLPANMIEEYTTGSFNQIRTKAENQDYVGYTSTYNSTSKTVTVTLSDDLAEGAEGDITFNFMAKYGNFADESKLEQTLEMPVLGSSNISLPFIFTPTGNGEAITKNAGTVTRAADGAEIDWTIWVNTQGKKLETGATVEDTPDTGHAFKLGSLTVEKFPVGLNGIDKSSPGTAETYTAGSTAFPISLDPGYYAYKITYKTKVNTDPTKTTMSYTNTASFKSSPTATAQPKTGTASITYGPSLEKNISKNDKYKATWQIKYNWLGENLSTKSSKVLEDSISANDKGAKHVIQYGTDFKVYRVTLSADGLSAASKTLLTKDADYELTSSTETGFKIDFSKDVANNPRASYLIEYDTVFEKEFVTDANAGDITNTVKRLDSNESKTAKVNINTNIFNKERTDVDYVNKTITWKLTINAEKPLTNFEIADTVSTKNKAGGTLKHKLIAWDSSEPTKVFNITGATTNYSTLNNGGNVGDEAFNMTFGSIPAGDEVTVTIEYKTKFDVEPNGSVATSYNNSATATWCGAGSTSYTATDTAEFAPTATSPTAKNGYKGDAKVNNATKEFSWKIGVNINKEDINGATLEDSLGAGHEIIIPEGKTLKDAISIKKLTLGVNDERGIAGNALDSSKWSVTEVKSGDKVTGFKITFASDLGTDNYNAYLVEYKTKDSDDVYGNGATTPQTYDNSAILKTPNGGEYKYSSTATITEQANKLITKTANPQPASDTIEWTVNVNESTSKLGNITLTDKPSSNQKLLLNTFSKQEITLNTSGGIVTGAVVNIDPTDITVNADGSFQLALGELNGKGYIIKYKTYFMGDPNTGEQVSNVASINYAGATSAGTSASGGDDKLFKYSSSDTNASPKKGTLKIKKQGINPLTGQEKELSGVKFEILTRTGDIVIAEATTDSNGELQFENLRYGIYKLRETVPTGYKPVAVKEIKLSDTNNFIVTNNPYTIMNIEDVDVSGACSQFELTFNDVDGKPIAGKSIKLVDVNGAEISIPGTTDANGKIKLPTSVQAGSYTVKDSTTGDILDTTIVKYGTPCNDVIQPAPSCPNFIISIKDEDGQPLESGIEVTVSGITGTFITNSNGQILLPNTTPAGKYNLTYGTKTIKDVEVTYKGTCQTEVTTPIQASCINYTITIKNKDGILPSTTVILKHSDGTTIVTPAITDANGKTTIPSTSKPGNYKVYDSNINYLGEVVVSYVNDCKADMTPTNACPTFTLTVNNVNGQARDNVAVVMKDNAGTNTIATGTTNAAGQITVPYTVGNGNYKLYEVVNGQEKLLGTITVKDCIAKYQPSVPVVPTPPAPTCDQDVTITVTPGNTITVDGKTYTDGDNDGKILVPIKDLPKNSTLPVTEDGKTTGTVTTGDCEASFTPAPSCSEAVVTLEEYANQTVSISKDGGTATTVKVDADGKLVIPHKDGKIVVSDAQGKEIGKVTLVDCKGTFEFTNACTASTITIPTFANKTVTVEHADKTVSVVFDKGGKAELPFTDGKVTLKDGEKVLGSVDLKDCKGTFVLEVEKETCTYPTSVTIPTEHAGKTATVKNGSTTTNVVVPQTGVINITFTEGTTTVTVEGTVVATVTEECKVVVEKEEIPVVPVKPDEEKPEPVEPTPEPEPEKPVEPAPTPEKPTEPKPTPQKPVTPSKPTPGTSGNNPGSGNNTGGNVPYTPGSPSLPTKVTDIMNKWNNTISTYPQASITKQAQQDLLTLVKEYENMTEEQRKQLEKIVDIEKVYDILIAEDVIPTNAKPSYLPSSSGKPGGAQKPAATLPQTDGNVNTAWTYVGLLLVLVSAFFLVRRRNA